MLIHATLTATLFFASQAEPTQDAAPAPAPEPETVVLEPTPPPPAPAAKPEVTAEDDDNKRECRRVPVIGTRMKKRVCASRKEWRDMAERSRATTGNLQRSGASPGSTGPGG